MREKLQKCIKFDDCPMFKSEATFEEKKKKAELLLTKEST